MPGSLPGSLPGKGEVTVRNATKQKEFYPTESRDDDDTFELTSLIVSTTTGPISQQQMYALKMRELELKKRDQDIKMRDQKIQEKDQEIQIEAYRRDRDTKMADQKIKMRDQDLKEREQSIQIEAQKRDYEMKMKDLEIKQRNQEIQVELEAQKRDHDLKMKDRETAIEKMELEKRRLDLLKGQQENEKRAQEYRNSQLNFENVKYISDQIANIDKKIEFMNIKEEEMIKANTPTNNIRRVGGLTMVGAGVGGSLGAVFGPAGVITGAQMGAAFLGGAVAGGVGIAASAKGFTNESDLAYLIEINRRERMELEANRRVFRHKLQNFSSRLDD